jgi:hypothetical protein
MSWNRVCVWLEGGETPLLHRQEAASMASGNGGAERPGKGASGTDHGTDRGERF